MVVMAQIDGQLVLVEIPTDVVRVNPERIIQLRESAEQRAHCTENCPLVQLCCTYEAYTRDRAMRN